MHKFNFHLTNACNYNCTYCFGKFVKAQPLPLEQACTVIDNIADYFRRNKITNGSINLAGGEPLLYPHLDELIDYIHAYRIKVSLITNGSLLSEPRIALWRGKVDCIGLSLDSANPSTNAEIGRICNNKTLSLKRAISITQAIHRNDIRLKINTVVSKFNAGEDFTEFYKRLKPDRLKFLQMSHVDDVNDHADKYAITPREFEQFCKRHKKCCANLVLESEEDMQNSYLMVDPKGDFLLNNAGEYQCYGSCVEESLCEILKRVPLDEAKFNGRYEKSLAPAVTEKKICVFGGHETWRKKIKKQVNARFFESGNLQSIHTIRGADEIWIQPNAISHSFYGKILAVARSHRITVKYFAFASARKCAEQLLNV